jgi:elongator complex protein 1
MTKAKAFLTWSTFVQLDQLLTMRSLELLGQRSAKVTSSEIKGRSFIATDPESLTVYIAFEDVNSQVRVAATNLAPGDPTAFVELGRCPASAIVSFTFLADLQVVCLCTYNGDIMLFSKERFEKGDEAVRIDTHVKLLKDKKK